MVDYAEIVMKKEFWLSGLSAILIAGFLTISSVQAADGSKEREAKKRVELTVVEKKPGEKPARSNEPRRQQPERRR